MLIGYYPGWDAGAVRDYLNALRDDGQRKKAAAKLDFDLHMLETTWPRPQFVTVKSLKGHEPLYELAREYQGIAYRISFCVRGQEIWLLHAIEKKQPKTPTTDLNLAYNRMRNVLAGHVRG
ncbi:MAG: type II toxin-antitoxin system RelE/ParE family toxin [Elusimicrobia bacterium]|nr:type II toxin-antitoxin system RelE/ParE family toxin [Elusimicrobiota bacterium]